MTQRLSATLAAETAQPVVRPVLMALFDFAGGARFILPGVRAALDGKAPADPSHSLDDVTGLSTALNGKAPTIHSHALSDLPVADPGEKSSVKLVRADDPRLSAGSGAGGLAAQRNLVVNGCARVSHRPAAALAATWQPGEVDLWQVRADGAVSGRWFYLGAIQLEAGDTATALDLRPIALEMALVHRQLRPIATAFGRANSGTNIQLTVNHPGMRAAPAYQGTAPLTITDMVTANYTQASAGIGSIHERTADGGRFDVSGFSGLTSGTPAVLTSLGGRLLASAEL